MQPEIILSRPADPGFPPPEPPVRTFRSHRHSIAVPLKPIRQPSWNVSRTGSEKRTYYIDGKTEHPLRSVSDLHRLTIVAIVRPRPGNLWVLLAQTAAPTCSAAPVTNSFSDMIRRRCRSLFPGGFFSARVIVSPLKRSTIHLPTAPRASLGSFASEPLSNGRSERSLDIGFVIL
jgi:hypothetical protein